jgi:hypothetical protein
VLPYGVLAGDCTCPDGGGGALQREMERWTWGKRAAVWPGGCGPGGQGDLVTSASILHMPSEPREAKWALATCQGPAVSPPQRCPCVLTER